MDIKKFLLEVSFNDVKDLPEVNGRVYLDEEMERKDAECENSSYLYLTIFDSPNENGKDRYFGSDTEFKTKSFMETDYLGTPVKRSDEFNKALAEKEHRILCLKIDDDEGSVLIEEGKVLVALNAKENPKFFNESNISGGRRKTLTKQTDLFNEITEAVEKTNRGEDGGYETGEDTVDNLHKMPRSQPRQYDLDKSLVNSLAKDIKGSKGKALKRIRKTILLENYHGPGEHRRGGNTHTIEACMKPSVKKYVVNKIGTVFIPEETWKQCTENTLRDILRWDNRNQDELTHKETDDEEIIESCFAFMNEFGLSHTDERVKKRAAALGARDSRWDRIRPKLRDLAAAKESQNVVPRGMELIHYTKGQIKKIEDNGTNDNVDLKVISTVYAGGTFNGWDFIIRWLNDPKNKNRTLYTKFMHGENSFQKYEDQWPEKQLDLIPHIKKLFKQWGKETHFTWDMLPRFQQKQNKV